MEFEKEILWIAILWKNKKNISRKEYCKKDFERFVKAPTNNKKFSIWFNKMVEFGVFQPTKNQIKNVICYKINFKLLIFYLEKNPDYNTIYQLCQKDTVLF